MNSIIITALVAVAVVMLLAAIVLMFLSKRYAAVTAYAGLLLTGLTAVTANLQTLVFWGVAAVIVTAICHMLPAAVATSQRGIGYIAGAALAGACVGMAAAHGWMVVGAVTGALLGGLAYGKTPAGKGLGFPSYRFLNYLCAKGLPAAVTVCMVCTATEWLMAACR